MIQMYYNQFAADVQGSDIYCTTAQCKYNWFRSVLFQSYFPSVYTGIQLQSVTRNFLDKTEQALHSFVFPLTLLCFLKWHFFFKLSADTGSWKLRFTSATFPQRCPPTAVSSPAIEVYPFFNIRTSNFGADAEPKVNVLIFGFLSWTLLEAENFRDRKFISPSEIANWPLFILNLKIFTFQKTSKGTKFPTSRYESST